MAVKDIIKQRRTELGLTLLDIAKQVGVSEGTVSRWESGDISNMRRDKIVALSNALKISPAVIMEWDEDPSKVEVFSASNTPHVFCSYKSEASAAKDLIEHLPSAQSPEAWDLCNKIFRLDSTDLSKTDGFVEALLTADKYNNPQTDQPKEEQQ